MIKDWKTPLIVIGIILLAFISYALVANPFKPIEKESLSDDDFKILSASWDDYEVNFKTGEYVADINRPIDWNIICNYCKTGFWEDINQSQISIEDRCKTGSYHLVTDASRDLAFNAAIDGISVEKLREATNDMWSISNGTSNINIILDYQGKIISNLDIRESHEITLCAIDTWRSLNFICKSTTLPAKCPLN